MVNKYFYIAIVAGITTNSYICYSEYNFLINQQKYIKNMNTLEYTPKAGFDQSPFIDSKNQIEHIANQTKGQLILKSIRYTVLHNIIANIILVPVGLLLFLKFYI